MLGLRQGIYFRLVLPHNFVKTRRSIERQVSRFKQLRVSCRFSPSETPISFDLEAQFENGVADKKIPLLERDTETRHMGSSGLTLSCQVVLLSRRDPESWWTDIYPHQLTFLFQARTLRLVINPHQPQEGVARSGGATRRLYILLYISLTQPVLMYFLTRHLNKYT